MEANQSHLQVCISESVACMTVIHVYGNFYSVFEFSIRKLINLGLNLQEHQDNSARVSNLMYSKSLSQRRLEKMRS